MKMPTELFQKEIDYCAAISIAKTMLQQGLVSADEYKIINKSLVERYTPKYSFAGAVPADFHAKDLDFKPI